MKDLKYFNLTSEYTSTKYEFVYPTVSYVEENSLIIKN